MQKLIDKIIKLIDVKSIMTLSLTGAVIFLLVKTGALPEQLNSIYLIIVGFYFGTQTYKKAETETTDI
jgi:hypothetical protein